MPNDPFYSVSLACHLLLLPFLPEIKMKFIYLYIIAWMINDLFIIVGHFIFA